MDLSRKRHDIKDNILIGNLILKINYTIKLLEQNKETDTYVIVYTS